MFACAPKKRIIPCTWNSFAEIGSIDIPLDKGAKRSCFFCRQLIVQLAIGICYLQKNPYIFFHYVSSHCRCSPSRGLNFALWKSMIRRVCISLNGSYDFLRLEDQWLRFNIFANDLITTASGLIFRHSFRYISRIHPSHFKAPLWGFAQKYVRVYLVPW